MNKQLPGSVNKMQQNRCLWADSLRGAAMVLVLLQHSYLNANYSLIPPLIGYFIWGVTYCAAIAFVSISGMMFSYFLYINSQGENVYRHYMYRAAFLILAAHPTINLMSCLFRLSGTVYSGDHSSIFTLIFLHFPITDTIGVCLLVAPLFIIRLSTVKMVGTITAMLILTVLIRAFVIPTSPYLQMFKEAIFGSLGEPKIFWVPLVPWLAIFLTGSFMGKAMARLKQGTIHISSLIGQMNRIGLILAILSLMLTVAYKVLKIAFGDLSPLLFRAIYPGQTTTLLPGYLAMITWLLAAMMHRIEISKCYDRYIWCLSLMGRTSLFTFVIQFAIVESIPALLGYSGTLGLAGFLSLFFTGLVIVCLLSYVYGRMRGWVNEDDYSGLAIRVRCMI